MKPELPIWNRDYVNTRRAWEEEQPPRDLLKKLEGELKFSVLDTSDMAQLQQEFGDQIKPNLSLGSGLPVISGTQNQTIEEYGKKAKRK